MDPTTEFIQRYPPPPHLLGENLFTITIHELLSTVQHCTHQGATAEDPCQNMLRSNRSKRLTGVGENVLSLRKLRAELLGEISKPLFSSTCAGVECGKILVPR
jgi:hypothetical protein